MTINTDKFIVPDGAPSAGTQDMKSGQWGETLGLLTNGVIKLPDTDGSDGDVITSDGAGSGNYKPIPSTGTTPYNASTNTSAPPSSGQNRWNAATQNLATKLFMSFTNSNGTDLKVFLNLTVVAGSRILFQLQTNQGQFQEWDVDVVVDQGTYLEIDVTLVGDAGGNYGNNNNILAIFLSGTSQAASFETASATVSLQSTKVASRFIEADASAGAFVLELPPSALVKGLAHIVKKVDTSNNAITIDGNAAELIDNELTLVVDSPQDSVMLIPNGTGWLRAQDYRRVIAFLANRSGQAQQSIPSGTPTTFQANQEQNDIGGYYDPVTFTWTPQPGIYFIHAHIRILLLDANDELQLTILKDGSPLYFDNRFSTSNNQNPAAQASGLANADGTNDFTVQIEHNQGGALNISSLPSESYFYGYRIG